MDTPLGGKVVVVTGATRGIGRHIALGLGAEGATVVVVGRTSQADPHTTLPGSVEGTVDELVALGVSALGVRADLTDPADTQKIVDETMLAFGRCDVLVNNAAYTSIGPMMTVPWHRWDRGFRVQVSAPLQLCQAFVPGMIERGEGAVLNISSGASQVITPHLSLYQTSKLAMERWSEHLAAEIAGNGVSVNTLRVDRAVSTEGWQYIHDTQGAEIATGGGSLESVMAPELVAEHALWMLHQPLTWSGQTLGFDDITALGGPPAPMLDPAIAGRSGASSEGQR